LIVNSVWKVGVVLYVRKRDMNKTNAGKEEEISVIEAIAEIEVEKEVTAGTEGKGEAPVIEEIEGGALEVLQSEEAIIGINSNMINVIIG